jgi:hypothetical protein
MRQHVAPIKVRVSTRQVLAERPVLARAPLTPRRCAAQERATFNRDSLPLYPRRVRRSCARAPMMVS